MVISIVMGFTIERGPAAPCERRQVRAKAGKSLVMRCEMLLDAAKVADFLCVYADLGVQECHRAGMSQSLDPRSLWYGGDP